MNKWLKIFFVILIFAIISICLFVVLKIFNLTNIEHLKHLIVQSNHFGLIIYYLILTSVITLFCFIPLLDTGLIVLGVVLFNPLNAFIVCLLAIFTATSILFFVGDKFGEKLAEKLIGKKDLEQAQNLIHTKSKLLLPLFYIVPGIPDEAISLVAGMTKMKYWYVVLTSCICHSIEIGLICFLGSDLIIWSSLSVLDWIILINMLIIDICFILKLEKHIKK